MARDLEEPRIGAAMSPELRAVKKVAPEAAPPPKEVKEVPAAAPSAVAPSVVNWDDPLLTCLSILAGLLERPMSTKALKAGLPLADNAFTPDMFIRAATRAGIAARLVRRKLKHISPLNLPCVMLLKEGNACVVTKLPAKGPAHVIMPDSGGGAQIDRKALEDQYTGYVLFAKAEYRYDGRSGEAVLPREGSWFWGTLKQLWPIYSHVLIASFVINLFALATSLFAMNVYDRVVPNNAVETLWVLAIGVFIVMCFDFVLRTARSYFVDAAGKGADVVLASRLFEHVMGMRFEGRPPSTGTLASHMREFESLRDFFTSATMLAFADLPFIFLFVFVASLIAGPLAFIPLAAIPVVVLIGFLLQLPLRGAIDKTFRETAQKQGILVESIEGLDTLKISGGEGRAQRNWERFVGMSARSSMQARTLSTMSINFILFAQNAVYVLVVVYGVFEIEAGNLTVGSLIAATILTGRAMAPLGQIAGLVARFHQSMSALRALNKLMATPLERPPGKVFVSRPSLRGQIEFRDVVFSYPNQKAPALSGVSFFVGAGEKVGIIGRIGSGKSTIGRLLVGLYQPNSGSILLDGADIRQIDPADLRRNVGYVPQEAFLFFGSVRENICIGTPHIDDEAMLRAATIAGVDDFLKRHPHGYDLQVGERGQYLSGGQRESITIARALLLDPPVLLMDEPTGSMDNSSETRLRARLTQVAGSKTMILITHRSSMLPNVDRLIVVDGGKIVADGPKDKVIESLSRGGVRATAV
jgi:ATP-binding cassette, subfamily C, bacterial LapB